MKILFFVILVLSPTLVFAEGLISDPAVNSYGDNQQNPTMATSRRLVELHLCGSLSECTAKAERIAHPIAGTTDDALTAAPVGPSKDGK